MVRTLFRVIGMLLVVNLGVGPAWAENGTLRGDAASRPNFVMPIYGAMPNVAIPADAPPAFVMVARDDSIMFDRAMEAGLMDHGYIAGQTAEWPAFQTSRPA